MTPQKGDTVRVLTGQWKGWTGEVVDEWKSGSIAVRFSTLVGDLTRTIPVDWVEVIR